MHRANQSGALASWCLHHTKEPARLQVWVLQVGWLPGTFLCLGHLVSVHYMVLFAIKVDHLPYNAMVVSGLCAGDMMAVVVLCLVLLLLLLAG